MRLKGRARKVPLGCVSGVALAVSPGGHGRGGGADVSGRVRETTLRKALFRSILQVILEITCQDSSCPISLFLPSQLLQVELALPVSGSEAA